MIFYHHIPKTGGQTLATGIASAFPFGQSSIMGPDLCFPDGLKELFSTYKFVERHVYCNVRPALKDIDILVTVREPVRQVVSNYLHVLREPKSPLYRPAKLLSSYEFFKRFGDMLANNQASNFVGAYSDFAYSDWRGVAWRGSLL